MKRISSTIYKTTDIITSTPVKSQKVSLIAFSERAQNTHNNSRAVVAFKDLKHYHDISVSTILRKRFRMPLEDSAWVETTKVLHFTSISPFVIRNLYNKDQVFYENLCAITEKTILERILSKPFYIEGLSSICVQNLESNQHARIELLLFFYGKTIYKFFIKPFINSTIIFNTADEVVAHMLKHNPQGLFSSVPEIFYKQLDIKINNVMSIIKNTTNSIERKKEIAHLKELREVKNAIYMEVDGHHPTDTYVTLIQHFTNFIFGHKKFSFAALKEFINSFNFDGTEYENAYVSMQLACEVSITGQVFRLYYHAPEDSVAIQLKNHNKPNEFQMQCKEETGQSNPDLKLDLLLRKLITFYDVKTYKENGVGKQTISLFQPSIKAYNQQINNIIKGMNNFAKKKEKKKELITLKKIKNEIDKIMYIKNNTALTLEQKFGQIFSIMMELTLNPERKIPGLTFSFAVPLPKDELFEKYYETVLKSNIEKSARENNIVDIIKACFPKTYTMGKIKHKEINTELLTRLYPDVYETKILPILKLLELNL